MLHGMLNEQKRHGEEFGGGDPPAVPHGASSAIRAFKDHTAVDTSFMLTRGGGLLKTHSDEANGVILDFASSAEAGAR